MISGFCFFNVRRSAGVVRATTLSRRGLAHRPAVLLRDRAAHAPRFAAGPGSARRGDRERDVHVRPDPPEPRAGRRRLVDRPGVRVLLAFPCSRSCGASCPRSVWVRPRCLAGGSHACTSSSRRPMQRASTPTALAEPRARVLLVSSRQAARSHRVRMPAGVSLGLFTLVLAVLSQLQPLVIDHFDLVLGSTRAWYVLASSDRDHVRAHPDASRACDEPRSVATSATRSTAAPFAWLLSRTCSGPAANSALASALSLTLLLAAAITSCRAPVLRWRRAHPPRLEDSPFFPHRGPSAKALRCPARAPRIFVAEMAGHSDREAAREMLPPLSRSARG